MWGRIYRGTGDDLNYVADDINSSRFVLRDSSSDNYEALYGADGDYFGLLDGDGNWAIQHQKDVQTNWRINNAEQMRLLSGGLAIGGTTLSSTLALDVLDK